MIFGVILGSIATVLYLKKSHTKLLNEQKDDFLQKSSEHESNYSQLSSEFNDVKSETNNQKEAAVQKIGDAFHTGSEMMEKMGTGLERIQQLVTNTSEPIQRIFETGNEAQGMISNSRSSILFVLLFSYLWLINKWFFSNV